MLLVLVDVTSLSLVAVALYPSVMLGLVMSIMAVNIFSTIVRCTTEILS